MSKALAARLSRAVVGCYPPRWQQRYREEILDVLDQHQASSRTVLSLAGGAMAAHLDPDYRVEQPVIGLKGRPVVRRLTQVFERGGGRAGLLVGLFFLARVSGLPDFSWQPIPTSGANALAVTPNQRLLATEVGGEATSALVTLWSVGHGGLRRLSSFEGGVAVAIAPDGRLVATSSFHGQAALWDVARPRHPALLSVLSARLLQRPVGRGILARQQAPGRRLRRRRGPVGRGPAGPAAAADRAGRARRPGDQQRHRVLP